MFSHHLFIYFYLNYNVLQQKVALLERREKKREEEKKINEI